MPFVKKMYEIAKPIPAFLFLMRELGYTQAQAQKILDKQRLMQNDRPVSKAECICGEVELCEFEALDLGLEPLFYNEDFCVYDKPHNLLIHPKGRFFHYSLNDALKSRFGRGANVVHRLDRQTSGLVLCAINPGSESALKDLMFSRRVKKTYRAIVEGELKDEICIDKPIATQKNKGGDLCIRSVITPEGKSSQTQIVPLGYDERTHTTLVEAIPLTGRTHQIRLHLSHIGHRILGDPLYGVSDEHSRIYLAHPELGIEEYREYFGAPYLCLNAYALEFEFLRKEYVFESKQKFRF